MAAKRELTTPDLVVLSILCEKPRHGYELNLELERRDVRDWAGISRPQVYYSLNKLARTGLIRRIAQKDSGGPGPEREVFAITPGGRAALARTLERPEWSEQRPPPPFLTWLALSQFAQPAAVLRQVDRRRAFLESQVVRERETRASFEGHEGYEFEAARSMVELTISHFEIEIEWLKRLRRRFASYMEASK